MRGLLPKERTGKTMKKVKFRRSGSAGKGVYIALCAGILAVGAVTFAGYKAAVGSLTKNIIPDVTIQTSPEPDIDTSQVDKILSDIERSEPQSTPVAADIPAPAQTPVDITDELQTLYYEQAKMFPVSRRYCRRILVGELVKASSGVWRTHDGIDLMADAGSDVKSMTSGKVTDIYSDPLWGNCVVIDHGETVIGCYYGLSPEISVAVGDSVGAGEVIGKVGNTADIESDLGPHLHFALKFEGSWIDPVSYIEPMK